MHDGSEAGELRALRTSRGLSLTQLSDRAGVAKSSLLAWESGHCQPRGASLRRILDVLEPEARLRARLMQAADPVFARIELAHFPLGAPVDVGRVIRAMRGRYGSTQADLARSLGVTQGTVARWESGEAKPSGATIQAIGFALGATPEETVALACASGTEPSALPSDPGDAHRLLCRNPVPEPLREVVLLGLEAELWRRAVRDPRWDPLLCDTLGARANLLFNQGRLDEVGEVARRAIRIAATPETHIAAAPAVGALASLARWRGDDPRPLASRLEGWIERLHASPNKAWMMWVRAVRLGTMGETVRALDLNERAVAMYGARFGDAGAHRVRPAWTAEVLLEAGLPERAAKEFAGPPDRFDDLSTYVRAEHACDRPVSEATMARFALPANWYAADRRARHERAQARFARRHAPQ